MPIVIQSGGHNRIDESMISAPIVFEDATTGGLHIYDSSITGLISASSPESNGSTDLLTAHASEIWEISLSGIGSRSIRLGDTRMFGRLQLVDVEEVTATGMKFDSTSNQNHIELDGCSNIYIQGHMSQANQHGVRAIDCVVALFDLLMSNPGVQTNDTYDGYSLEGSCDRITIRGAIHGDVSGNKPSYGVDIASTCTQVHICAHITDFVDGAVRDLTSGEVSYCSGGGSHIDAFSYPGEVEVYTGLHRLVWPFDIEILSVRVTAGVAPTGADIEVDILNGGSSIMTTMPTVPASSTVGTKVAPTSPLIAEGDDVTVDITQVGSTVAGEALTVIVEWRQV